MGDEALREFATEQEAIDWAGGEMTGHDTCVDNFRFAWADDPVAVAAYDEQVGKGCCGFVDEKVTVRGRPALVGCNYGH